MSKRSFKKKILEAMPRVFSLSGNNYDKFVVIGGASSLMQDAWRGVGERFNGALLKVARENNMNKVPYVQKRRSA